MFLDYSNKPTDGRFFVADLCCKNSLTFLKEKGYYKIIWAAEKDINLKVDGHDLILNHRQLLLLDTNSHLFSVYWTGNL